MSTPQTSFSKRAAPALSLNIASRATSLKIECLSANKENCPEVSTPHLPKKTAFNSKTGLSLKKAQLSDNPEEITYEQDSPLPPLELPEWTPTEPKSALLRKKQAELSFSGGESSLVTNVTSLASQGSIERDYNDELYKRAEEYLDSQHLVIVLPEDHRRRPFGNLRVSTAKVALSDSGPSEFNSPSLISPSIHTASLLQRRSSSKKMDSDETPVRPKLMLAKSPFYTGAAEKKGKGLFGIERTISNDAPVEPEDDNATSKDKLNEGVSIVSPFKISGLYLRGSRELSEPLSASSFKMEEDSPVKIII